MEQVVSEGSSLSDVKSRWRRMYKLEDDAMTKAINKEDEVIAEKKTRAVKNNKKDHNPGISIDASFPAQVDFNHPYRQLLMALKTKPFLLIAGTCGSGKSRFARALAYQTCPKHLQENGKPGNFELIAIQPNWHDNEEILGWINRKDIFQITPFLHFLVKSWLYPQVPFILCLDEMNLAKTEHYFADFLSIVESRQFINGKLVSDPFISGPRLKGFAENDPGMWERFGISLNQDLQRFFMANGIMLPPNLVIIGTANIDEAGHQFSMKALDRMMVAELNQIDLYAGIKVPNTDLHFPAVPLNGACLLGQFLQGEDAYFSSPSNGDLIISELLAIDKILSDSPFRFGFRVRDAALIYCAHNAKLDRNKANNDWLYTCLDEIVLMKILPRISGSYSATEKIIDSLLRFTKKKYPRSFKRLSYMKNSAENAYLISFWN